MAQWRLIVDVARCHDCNNCFMACKDEFVDNECRLTLPHNHGTGTVG